MQNSVTIVEVAPRDGLQNEKRVLDVETRIDLTMQAARAGARRIEAASFVNPKRVPQMAEGEAIIECTHARLSDEGLSANLIGLVLNERGFERALSCGVDEINSVVFASETFNQRNQNASIAQTMTQIGNMAKEAARADVPLSVTISASFGCPFEGETDAALVADIAAQAGEFGVFEIALADTIGAASPFDVTERFNLAMPLAPDVQWRCHFHNTRNTGLANAVAALQAGVRVMDSSIGGIGGCPFAPAATGNIPTEDLVYMLGRMGIETGLDIEAMCKTTKWLETQLGVTPPGMLWRAGNFPPL